MCSTKNLSTEEWLKIRTLGIGGSDAGIIAGCNPYRSIFELWQEKRGEIPVKEEESEVIHFGKVLEDVVRKEFIQRTGLMVRRKNSILRSKEYPFMIADLDGVVSEFDGTYSIFEAKTAIEFKNNDWKNGEIPKAYQLQVQHYLAVTGFQKAYIAVLVGGNKFYWTEIYRDEQLIKMLVSMESHFWHCVKTGEEPDVDASKATSLYLGAKYSNPKVGSIPFMQVTDGRGFTSTPPLYYMVTDTSTFEEDEEKMTEIEEKETSARDAIVMKITGEGEDDPGENSDESEVDEEQDSSKDGDYILEGSDSRYITEKEVENLSDADCRLARNEIYARHGRIFDSADLKDYFESKSWYKGTVKPNDFDESVLNKYEKANIDLISSME